MDFLRPWLEGFGVAASGLIAAGVGRWFTTLPGRRWMWGYFLPMGVVLLFGMIRWQPQLRLVEPWSWVATGRTQFAIVAPITGLLLSTLAAKLGRKSEARMFGCLGVLVVATGAVWPFLAPAFNRSFLNGIQTRLDVHGVCLQSTDYTCGPAAAVTALRRFGIEAGEGEIGLAASTSPAIGTPPDMLASTLERLYADKGIRCRLRFFESPDQLKSEGGAKEITLAVIRFGFLVDHYVAVLEVHPDHIVVGDPAVGRQRVARDEFLKQWKRMGVTIYSTSRAR